MVSKCLNYDSEEDFDINGRTGDQLAAQSTLRKEGKTIYAYKIIKKALKRVLMSLKFQSYLLKTIGKRLLNP